MYRERSKNATLFVHKYNYVPAKLILHTTEGTCVYIYMYMYIYIYIYIYIFGK